MNRDSLGVAAVALGFVLLATLVAWLQKKTPREVLGFDPKKGWEYRDIALGTVASIATLWAIVALGFESSAFDHRLGIVCVVIAVTCCLISPNRLVLSMMVIGVVSMQGWFAVAFSGDARSWWIAAPATAIEIALLLLFGKRPVRQK